MFWTDERITELRRMWDDGTTASKIAAFLGTSRCAVLGKAHRLDLPARAISTTPEERQRREREREQVRADKRKAWKEGQRQFPERKISVDDPASTPDINYSLNIPFGELRLQSSIEKNQCRYIAASPAGPEYLACGNETAPGEAWCARCKEVVFYRKAVIPDQETERRRLHFKRLTRKAMDLDEAA